jgi:hypothetical protein
MQDIWMQSRGVGWPRECTRGRVQASLVKELLAAGSDYAGTYPMVVMIDMDPKTRIPMTTVGMLFKHPMSPKEARVRLQALLLSVTQQLEKDLDTSSILLDQCQKHHSMAEKGKVAGSDAEPVLKQMLEFCQKCLGCEGDLVQSSSTTNPVCERRVDLLVCSLPLHRHSYIGFILAFASSFHNKQQFIIRAS